MAGVAVPGRWPALLAVAIDGRPATVRYEIDRGRWIDPLHALDGRRRRLVEAFSSLPVTISPTRTRVVDQARLQNFLMTFGPFWSGGVDADLEADLASPGWPVPTDDLDSIGAAVVRIRAVISDLDALARLELKRRALVDEIRVTSGRQRADAEAELGGLLRHQQGNRADLAAVLSSHLSDPPGGVDLRVTADPAGRLGVTLRLRSLLGGAYWQLAEQVVRRPVRYPDDAPDPVFPLPWCGSCGGAVFGSRLADDKVNRWHSGACKAAGQARARRARQREARNG